MPDKHCPDCGLTMEHSHKFPDQWWCDHCARHFPDKERYDDWWQVGELEALIEETLAV